jgi:hypothetical protein
VPTPDGRSGDFAEDIDNEGIKNFQAEIYRLQIIDDDKKFRSFRIELYLIG